LQIFQVCCVNLSSFASLWFFSSVTKWVDSSVFLGFIKLPV
jgi:hypothetical protein